MTRASAAALFDSAAELFAELRRQPVRALLSLSGVAWGVLSLLLLLAFSVGFGELFERRQKALGDGIAIAWPSTTTRAWRGLPAGRRLSVTRDDVRAVGAAVPGLEAISAEFAGEERIAAGASVVRVPVSGVDAEFAHLRVLEPRAGGRCIQPSDVEQRRRVIFLGDQVASALFGDVDPVGRTLVLRDATFLVVGVLRHKDQDSDYGTRDEDRVFVPATTFADVWGARFVNDFVYRAQDTALQAECTGRVVQALAARLGFDPADTGALVLWDTTEEQRMVATIFLAFHLVLGIAGVFTLLAGGVGIAQLMFLLVKRRTSEIGLLLAIGARPARIHVEVLAQTLVLVACGGLVGAGVAVALVAVGGSGPWIADIGVPRIPAALAVATVLLLATIGVAAGWYPARAAARMHPVEALAGRDGAGPHGAVAR